jgi:TRAP-type C4-dicarboxylate transport system substrate-binding protein
MSRKHIFSVAIVLILSLALGLLGACGSPTTTTETKIATATTTVNSTAIATTTTTSTTTTLLKPITLVFNEFEPKGSFWETDLAKPWFDELSKRTNGRVIVDAHWGGEIAGLFDAYDAINKGTVDFGKILPTMDATKFPMDGAMIFGPVNQKNPQTTQMWLDLYNQFPEFQKQYEATPLVGLATMACAGLFTTKNRVVTKMEDVKGFKSPGGGPASESRLKAVGIVPVSLQPSEAYMAFKTGTLDMIAAAMHSPIDFGWADALSNVSVISLNGSPWSYVMNKKTWNSLPPDIQKIMTDMIPWIATLNDQVQAKVDGEARTILTTKYNIKITNISQTELDRWAVVDNPTLDAYIKDYVTAKGLPGDKLKTEFNRLWQKYSTK